MTGSSGGLVNFLANPALDRSRAYGPELLAIQSVGKAQDAMRTISAWPGYAPTPLVALRTLTASLGVGSLHMKHEGHRFELKSFKALGGAYAVERIARLSKDPTRLTFVCATDGNHGRSVAWGARRVGARSVIYVHETVSVGRAAAIAAFGAEVRREGRTYDDAVRAADKAARESGWPLVSDTSYPGYVNIPRDVMQGYSIVPMEIEAQGLMPTHVVVPGGVGGFAASVLAYRWERYGALRPRMLVVEPERAACLLASARAGRATAIGGELETIMAGLSCGEPSLIAWDILQPGADAFCAITDGAAAEAMRTLADLGQAVGESGAASLAGLLALGEEQRASLSINALSRVLIYATEGATDVDVYRQIVGRAAAEVEPSLSPSRRRA
jgi:diaminopropionate ammonia-lyase